ECPTYGPNLLVNTVTFTGNLIIERDTEGNFTKPEWDMNRSADQQVPICYLRNSSVTLTVEFRVLGSRTYSGSVTVKGTTKIKGQEVTWSDTVTLVKDAPRAVMSNVVSGRKLPDQVGCYDPVTIVWEVTTPKGGPFPAGVSQHCFYALLALPSGTPLYWT